MCKCTFCLLWGSFKFGLSRPQWELTHVIQVEKSTYKCWASILIDLNCTFGHIRPCFWMYPSCHTTCDHAATILGLCSGVRCSRTSYLCLWTKTPVWTTLLSITHYDHVHVSVWRGTHHNISTLLANKHLKMKYRMSPKWTLLLIWLISWHFNYVCVCGVEIFFKYLKQIDRQINYLSIID